MAWLPMTRRGRAWIAFLFHAPGLWLFCPTRFTPRIIKANLIALALTVIATALSVMVTTRYALWVGLAAWSIGHFLWGAYLARALDREVPI
jgi:hypothetical protein